jgi:hypothetical protein
MINWNYSLEGTKMTAFAQGGNVAGANTVAGQQQPVNFRNPNIGLGVILLLFAVIALVVAGLNLGFYSYSSTAIEYKATRPALVNSGIGILGLVLLGFILAMLGGACFAAQFGGGIGRVFGLAFCLTALIVLITGGPGNAFYNASIGDWAKTNYNVTNLQTPDALGKFAVVNNKGKTLTFDYEISDAGTTIKYLGSN